MNLVELGLRIKKLRSARGMTLEDLAIAAGVTRSWISKVENFRMTPSLPAITKVAHALGVSLSDLFQGIDENPRIVWVKPEERIEVRRDEPVSGQVYESLAHKRPGRQMDPFVIRVPAGDRRPPLTHEGEEFLLVIRGRVGFSYDGEEYALGAGDALYFDGQVPHGLHNPHQADAEVLVVFYGNGTSPNPMSRDAE